MQITPLHDRVLVEPLDAEEKTAGGIIIPDTAQEKPMEGKIVAVGKGSRNDEGKVTPLDVVPGRRRPRSIRTPRERPFLIHAERSA